MDIGEEFIKLFDGSKIPIIGWNSYQADREKMENSIEDALSAGCRHISTDFSENEDVLGNVLDRWFLEGKLNREDIFVSAKLPYIGNTLEKTEYFLRKSLKNLKLDYVNLYSISSPVGFTYVNDETLFPATTKEGNELSEVDLDRHTDLICVWKGMESLVDAGFTKSIGMANFNSKQLRLIIRNARVPPAVIEMECHVYFQQNELLQVCKRFEVAVASFLPFGLFVGSEGIFSKHTNTGTGDGSTLLENTRNRDRQCPTKNLNIIKFSVRHNKTPRQILVRYLVQSGVIINLYTPEFERKYGQVFDFELTDDEMSKISKLDKGRAGRTFNLADIIRGFDTHPENPFQAPF